MAGSQLSCREEHPDGRKTTEFAPTITILNYEFGEGYTFADFAPDGLADVVWGYLAAEDAARDAVEAHNDEPFNTSLGWRVADLEHRVYTAYAKLWAWWSKHPCRSARVAYRVHGHVAYFEADRNCARVVDEAGTIPCGACHGVGRKVEYLDGAVKLCVGCTGDGRKLLAKWVPKALAALSS